MFKSILLIFAALAAIFVIVVMIQPSEFRITRSVAVTAPSTAVFPYVNDFHKWQVWSPWAKIDPACKVEFEGPVQGTGAFFHWAGSNEVGEGSMAITESRPDEYVRMRLTFLKPFAATNTAEFTLKPQGGQTSVTWTMSGTNGFMGKAVGLVMNCDKMVGDQFEKGLATLKALTEAGPK